MQSHAYDTIICDDVFGWQPGEVLSLEIHRGCISRLTSPGRDVSGVPEGLGRVLDLRGRLLLPGLIDAHAHAISTGMLMLSIDLHEVSTLDALAEAVRSVAARGSETVRLGGLDPSRLSAADATRLTRAWLDSLLAGRALMIKSVEGHSTWFNTKAWELLGIDAALAACGVPPEEQERMHQSGRVTGATYEELTTTIYDTYTAEERRAGMLLVLEQAARAGLTGIHCLEGYGARRREDFELIRHLDGQGCDLTLYARLDKPDLARELGLTRFGGCWCVDGAIGAYSAAISEPYADRPESRGELYFSDEQLSAWIESGLRAGMQVCVHAIGERALDQVIGIYERLAGSYDLPPRRHRVDHFVLGTPELARRAAAIGLVSAMQPAFDARWGGPSGGYAVRLGAERALRSNPVGAMLDAGLKIAGSSDSYITPLDPLGGIRAAMQHHNPALRVGFEKAVELFSCDAAYLAHQEDSRGRIAPGYSADFTVVRGDRTLAGAEVAMTIKAGKIVYQASAYMTG